MLNHDRLLDCRLLVYNGLLHDDRLGHHHGLLHYNGRRGRRFGRKKRIDYRNCRIAFMVFVVMAVVMPVVVVMVAVVVARRGVCRRTMAAMLWLGYGFGRGLWSGSGSFSFGAFGLADFATRGGDFRCVFLACDFRFSAADGGNGRRFAFGVFAGGRPFGRGFCHCGNGDGGKSQCNNQFFHNVTSQGLLFVFRPCMITGISQVVF